MGAASLVLVALLLPGQTAAPLTREQSEKLRELVQRTQQESAALRGELEKRQQELVRRYEDYALDAAAVEKLQEEILGLQRKLLASYHRMHVEMRAVVDRERFLTLNQRISRLVGPPLSKPAAPTEKRP